MTQPRPIIIGVMGGGSVGETERLSAYHLGKLIAENGWVLLNGGRDTGIMDASAKGAKAGGGMTVGILPDSDLQETSSHIDIPILTGMGSARNCINVLSSNIVVACPGGFGTLSEIALAMKYGKPVILLNFKAGEVLDPFMKSGQLFFHKTPEGVITRIKNLLDGL
jgi:uncharacterized protein (TIGR00725 family)